jgi:ankyrin repeat protein
MLAARYGQIGVVKILTDTGVNIDFQGFHGWNALRLANQFGHKRTASILIDSGADCDAVDNDGISTLNAGFGSKCWGVLQ